MCCNTRKEPQAGADNRGVFLLFSTLKICLGGKDGALGCEKKSPVGSRVLGGATVLFSSQAHKLVPDYLSLEVSLNHRAVGGSPGSPGSALGRKPKGPWFLPCSCLADRGESVAGAVFIPGLFWGGGGTVTDPWDRLMGK